MVQNFKGDTTELKMQSVADPLLDLTNAALNEFYANGFESSPFILAMYDDDRMPFSDKINRDSFVSFVKQAFVNFPFTGTFQVYIDILKSIFGQNVEILFDVPDPGVLTIDISAISDSEDQFVAREFIDQEFVFFDMIDDEGNLLTFRSIPGINTAYELELLLSEVIPCGIVPDVSLNFYSNYFFVADADGDDTLYDVVDYSGNQIIFREIGG